MSKCSYLGVWMIAIASIHCLKASQTKQPNIVFVLADDLGYHDVGYHGSEIQTPHLDQLSANGVRLENYYVQPLCSPTRSQFLSGRYQIHTGLQHKVIHAEQPNALPRDSLTVADKLKEAGYTTHMVGKWHLGFYKEEFVPTSRGFDTFFGFYCGVQDYFTHMRKYQQGTPYLDLRDQTTPVFNETGRYSAHLFTSKAIERIKNHDSSKPFFLYLAYQSVHEPLEVPDDYVKPYQHIKDPNRRAYAGMVAALDEGVGNITKALIAAGMWDNTVFVFSTDNGGQVHAGGSNFPLRGNKATLWEGGVRGVGFVQAPNMTAAKTVNRGLLHVSDWLPTFVGLAGGNLNGTKDLDGFDQWNTISKNHPSPRKILLHNIDILHSRRGKRLYNDTFDNRIRAGLRYGDWKLITGEPGNGSWFPAPDTNDLFFMPEKGYPHNQNLWLFNVVDDPSERIDLSSQYPTVVRKLLEVLASFKRTEVPPRYPPFDHRSKPSLHGDVWGPWE